MTCSIQISCWLYNIPEKISAALSQALRTKSPAQAVAPGAVTALPHPKATPPVVVTQQTPDSHGLLLPGSVFVEGEVVWGELNP